MDAQIKVSLINAVLAILVPTVTAAALTYIKGRLTPRQRSRAEALTKALGGERAIMDVILAASTKTPADRRDWAVAELRKLAESKSLKEWSTAVANQVVENFLEKSKEVAR